MSWRRGFGALVVASIAALPSAALAAGHSSDRLSLSVDRVRISTQLGHRFLFRSTITNRGSEAATGLIAHLNILSLRNGVYVDPEDWSTNRTRYLNTILPGRSITTTWRMHAVNDGSFGIYIAVVPETGTASPPPTAPLIRLAVAERRTLNSGGILPLTLVVPALLGAATLGLRRRRSR